MYGREGRIAHGDRRLLAEPCAQVSEAAWRSMPWVWVRLCAGSVASCHAVRTWSA